MVLLPVPGGPGCRSHQIYVEDVSWKKKRLENHEIMTHSLVKIDGFFVFKHNTHLQQH